MSNVSPIAWRMPCWGLRGSSSFLPNSDSVWTRIRPFYTFQRNNVHRPLISTFSSYLRPISPPRSISYLKCNNPRTKDCFPCLVVRSVQTKNASHFDTEKKQPVEDGVPVSSRPLSASEISSIFGPGEVSPALGNRILNVLQGRRLKGTLDLDLPADIVGTVRPRAIKAALNWLRRNRPVDEDAAVMARVEREELEEEERIARRIEKLGLDKPQSGFYGAELGQGNDIYGRSVLKDAREKNEAKFIAEEEKGRKEWMEGEAKDRERLHQQLKQNTGLQKYDEAAAVVDEARPRADPREHPFLAWVQKHHLRATSSDLDISNITTLRRILPALGVTIVSIALCCIFAESYKPPSHEDRLWPDVSPSKATMMAIISANIVVFCLWKAWPPSWRLLNRYFISVPLYPNAFSVVGSNFSHQQLKHLAVNMAILWFIGTKLHEEIGRGNFLAIYFGSGIFGSMVSLTSHVLMGRLTITSLGASGAIAGLLATYCTLHANDRLTLFFLPREWQETFSAPGYMFLAGIVAFEVFCLTTRYKSLKLDYWAHLGGYFSGVTSAALLLSRSHKPEARRGRRRRQQGDKDQDNWFKAAISKIFRN
ncbi:hypothetical protein Egran_00306 [Elaphomyces granulatus]|uniref:Peptidase S54 rhomboid domain-containing protein n=1 Tax=Elaphomyces granulatus TaxID=519963 RepID=A0A232M744_9EURO|nr:hypothetical protein Egran_00306 [Elaphomyces granulatus]